MKMMMITKEEQKRKKTNWKNEEQEKRRVVVDNDKIDKDVENNEAVEDKEVNKAASLDNFGQNLFEVLTTVTVGHDEVQYFRNAVSGAETTPEAGKNSQNFHNSTQTQIPNVTAEDGTVAEVEDEENYEQEEEEVAEEEAEEMEKHQ